VRVGVCIGAGSGGHVEEFRKVLVDQSYGRGHEGPAALGEPPSSRAWDLGDEAVEMKPLEQTRDLGAESSTLGRVGGVPSARVRRPLGSERRAR